MASVEDNIKENVFWILSVVVLLIVLCFYLFFSSRLFAWIVTKIIQIFFLDRGTVFYVTSLSISPISGRLFFNRLVYFSPNLRVCAVGGHVTFWWWGGRRGGLLGELSSPCQKRDDESPRLGLSVNGLDVVVIQNLNKTNEALALAARRAMGGPERSEGYSTTPSTSPPTQSPLLRLLRASHGVAVDIRGGLLFLGAPTLPYPLRLAFNSCAGTLTVRDAPHMDDLARLRYVGALSNVSFGLIHCPSAVLAPTAEKASTAASSSPVDRETRHQSDKASRRTAGSNVKLFDTFDAGDDNPRSVRLSRTLRGLSRELIEEMKAVVGGDAASNPFMSSEDVFVSGLQASSHAGAVNTSSRVRDGRSTARDALVTEFGTILDGAPSDVVSVVVTSDIPGIVRRGGIRTTADLPSLGIILGVYSKTIRYSPFADYCRGAIQRLFFPQLFSDRDQFIPTIGVMRPLGSVSIRLDFPCSPPPRIAVHVGQLSEETEEADPRNHSTDIILSFRRTLIACQPPRSVGPSGHIGSLVIKLAKESAWTFDLPLVEPAAAASTSSSAIHPPQATITAVDFRNMSICTSLEAPGDTFLRAQRLKLVLSMPWLARWNAPRTWDCNLGLHNGDLYFLGDFILLIQDLIRGFKYNEQVHLRTHMDFRAPEKLIATVTPISYTYRVSIVHGGRLHLSCAPYNIFPPVPVNSGRPAKSFLTISAARGELSIGIAGVPYQVLDNNKTENAFSFNFHQLAVPGFVEAEHLRGKLVWTVFSPSELRCAMESARASRHKRTYAPPIPAGSASKGSRRDSQPAPLREDPTSTKVSDCLSIDLSITNVYLVLDGSSIYDVVQVWRNLGDDTRYMATRSDAMTFWTMPWPMRTRSSYKSKILNNWHQFRRFIASENALQMNPLETWFTLLVRGVQVDLPSISSQMPTPDTGALINSPADSSGSDGKDCKVSLSLYQIAVDVTRGSNFLHLHVQTSPITAHCVLNGETVGMPIAMGPQPAVPHLGVQGVTFELIQNYIEDGVIYAQQMNLGVGDISGILPIHAIALFTRWFQLFKKGWRLNSVDENALNLIFAVESDDRSRRAADFLDRGAPLPLPSTGIVSSAALLQSNATQRETISRAVVGEAFVNWIEHKLLKERRGSQFAARSRMFSFSRLRMIFGVLDGSSPRAKVLLEIFLPEGGNYTSSSIADSSSSSRGTAVFPGIRIRVLLPKTEDLMSAETEGEWLIAGTFGTAFSVHHRSTPPDISSRFDRQQTFLYNANDIHDAFSTYCVAEAQPTAEHEEVAQLPLDLAHNSPISDQPGDSSPPRMPSLAASMRGYVSSSEEDDPKLEKDTITAKQISLGWVLPEEDTSTLYGSAVLPSDAGSFQSVGSAASIFSPISAVSDAERESPQERSPLQRRYSSSYHTNLPFVQFVSSDDHSNDDEPSTVRRATNQKSMRAFAASESNLTSSFKMNPESLLQLGIPTVESRRASKHNEGDFGYLSRDTNVSTHSSGTLRDVHMALLHADVGCIQPARETSVLRWSMGETPVAFAHSMSCGAFGVFPYYYVKEVGTSSAQTLIHSTPEIVRKAIRQFSQPTSAVPRIGASRVLTSGASLLHFHLNILSSITTVLSPQAVTGIHSIAVDMSLAFSKLDERSCHLCVNSMSTTQCPPSPSSPPAAVGDISDSDTGITPGAALFEPPSPPPPPSIIPSLASPKAEGGDDSILDPAEEWNAAAGAWRPKVRKKGSLFRRKQQWRSVDTVYSATIPAVSLSFIQAGQLRRPFPPARKDSVPDPLTLFRCCFLDMKVTTSSVKPPVVFDPTRPPPLQSTALSVRLGQCRSSLVFLNNTAPEAERTYLPNSLHSPGLVPCTDQCVLSADADEFSIRFKLQNVASTTLGASAPRGTPKRAIFLENRTRKGAANLHSVRVSLTHGAISTAAGALRSWSTELEAAGAAIRTAATGFTALNKHESSPPGDGVCDHPRPVVPSPASKKPWWTSGLHNGTLQYTIALNNAHAVIVHQRLPYRAPSQSFDPDSDGDSGPLPKAVPVHGNYLTSSLAIANVSLSSVLTAQAAPWGARSASTSIPIAVVGTCGRFALDLSSHLCTTTIELLSALGSFRSDQNVQLSSNARSSRAPAVETHLSFLRRILFSKSYHIFCHLTIHAGMFRASSRPKLPDIRSRSINSIAFECRFTHASLLVTTNDSHVNDNASSAPSFAASAESTSPTASSGAFPRSQALSEWVGGVVASLGTAYFAVLRGPCEATNCFLPNPANSSPLLRACATSGPLISFEINGLVACDQIGRSGVVVNHATHIAVESLSARVPEIYPGAADDPEAPRVALNVARLISCAMLEWNEKVMEVNFFSLAPAVPVSAPDVEVQEHAAICAVDASSLDENPVNTSALDKPVEALSRFRLSLSSDVGSIVLRIGGPLGPLVEIPRVTSWYSDASRGMEGAMRGTNVAKLVRIYSQGALISLVMPGGNQDDILRIEMPQAELHGVLGSSPKVTNDSGPGLLHTINVTLLGSLSLCPVRPPDVESVREELSNPAILGLHAVVSGFLQFARAGSRPKESPVVVLPQAPFVEAKTARSASMDAATLKSSPVVAAAKPLSAWNVSIRCQDFNAMLPGAIANAAIGTGEMSIIATLIPDTCGLRYEADFVIPNAWATLVEPASAPTPDFVWLSAVVGGRLRLWTSSGVVIPSPDPAVGDVRPRSMGEAVSLVDQLRTGALVHSASADISTLRMMARPGANYVLQTTLSQYGPMFWRFRSSLMLFLKRLVSPVPVSVEEATATLAPAVEVIRTHIKKPDVVKSFIRETRKYAKRKSDVPDAMVESQETGTDASKSGRIPTSPLLDTLKGGSLIIKVEDASFLVPIAALSVERLNCIRKLGATLLDNPIRVPEPGDGDSSASSFGETSDVGTMREQLAELANVASLSAAGLWYPAAAACVSAFDILLVGEARVLTNTEPAPVRPPVSEGEARSANILKNDCRHCVPAVRFSVSCALGSTALSFDEGSAAEEDITTALLPMDLRRGISVIIGGRSVIPLAHASGSSHKSAHSSPSPTGAQTYFRNLHNIAIIRGLRVVSAICVSSIGQLTKFSCRVDSPPRALRCRCTARLPFLLSELRSAFETASLSFRVRDKDTGVLPSAEQITARRFSGTRVQPVRHRKFGTCQHCLSPCKILISLALSGGDISFHPSKASNTLGGALRTHILTSARMQPRAPPYANAKAPSTSFELACIPLPCINAIIESMPHTDSQGDTLKVPGTTESSVHTHRSPVAISVELKYEGANPVIPPAIMIVAYEYHLLLGGAWRRELASRQEAALVRIAAHIPRRGGKTRPVLAIPILFVQRVASYARQVLERHAKANNLHTHDGNCVSDAETVTSVESLKFQKHGREVSIDAAMRAPVPAGISSFVLPSIVQPSSVLPSSPKDHASSVLCCSEESPDDALTERSDTHPVGHIKATPSFLVSFRICPLEITFCGGSLQYGITLSLGQIDAVSTVLELCRASQRGPSAYGVRSFNIVIPLIRFYFHNVHSKSEAILAALEGFSTMIASRISDRFDVGDRPEGDVVEHATTAGTPFTLGHIHGAVKVSQLQCQVLVQESDQIWGIIQLCDYVLSLTKVSAHRQRKSSAEGQSPSSAQAAQSGSSAKQSRASKLAKFRRFLWSKTLGSQRADVCLVIDTVRCRVAAATNFELTVQSVTISCRARPAVISGDIIVESAVGALSKHFSGAIQIPQGFSIFFRFNSAVAASPGTTIAAFPTEHSVHQIIIFLPSMSADVMEELLVLTNVLRLRVAGCLFDIGNHIQPTLRGNVPQVFDAGDARDRSAALRWHNVRHFTNVSLSATELDLFLHPVSLESLPRMSSKTSAKIMSLRTTAQQALQACGAIPDDVQSGERSFFSTMMFPNPMVPASQAPSKRVPRTSIVSIASIGAMRLVLGDPNVEDMCIILKNVKAEIGSEPLPVLRRAIGLHLSSWQLSKRSGAIILGCSASTDLEIFSKQLDAASPTVYTLHSSFGDVMDASSQPADFNLLKNVFKSYSKKAALDNRSPLFMPLPGATAQSEVTREASPTGSQFVAHSIVFDPKVKWLGSQLSYGLHQLFSYLGVEDNVLPENVLKLVASAVDPVFVFIEDVIGPGKAASGALPALKSTAEGPLNTSVENVDREN